MPPRRPAGPWRRVLGLILGFVFVAGGSGLAVQAGSPTTYQVALPVVIEPPAPIYLPFVNTAPPPPQVDLSVSRIEIIQGITMADPYVVHVAGRPALVRVFVGLTGVNSQAGVSGRLTRYVGGSAQDALDTGPMTVLAATSESSLAQTLNFNLPANWLAAGTSFVFQLDPSNTIAEFNEDNNRYPAGGDATFNFQDAPALDVVIVPVHYARSGAPATDPPTADLSYLTWMPFKVYPLSQINYSLHSPVNFTGNLSDLSGQGWVDLLNTITDVHQSEDMSEHQEYFGLVDSVAADGCNGGCIAGIGWVNQQGPYLRKSAVGFAGFPDSRNQASRIMTHEMGHTFGRYHSPCGTTNGVDMTYPYPGAALGHWGDDIGNGQLLDPNTYRDYMSYCDPAWTSDFTYKALFDAWSWVINPFPIGIQASPTAAWVVGGSFDQTDHWQVGPAHVETVPPARLSESGPFRLELLNGSGGVLRSQSFASISMALDSTRAGFYRQGFRIALPMTPGLAGFRIFRDKQLLYERLVKGPAPQLGSSAQRAASANGTRVGWSLAAGSNDVTYTVRASWDAGQTWQVLVIDQREPSVGLVLDGHKGQTPTTVEVQASDGVRTDTRAYTVPAPP